MKTQDAKFVLRAHRADGRYRTEDPLFAEALAEAARDPGLADWLAREHALDASVARQLDNVQPPAGLRDAILVGARASRLSRRWWRRPAWLAAAASLAVLLAVSGTLLQRERPEIPPASLAEFGLDQLAFARHAHPRGESAAALEAMLAAHQGPLCRGLGLDCTELARRGCQELSFDGRRVYEVCFRRNGLWYHLYVSTRESEDVAPGSAPLIVERNGLTAALWTEGSTVYALATTAGRDALTSVL